MSETELPVAAPSVLERFAQRVATRDEPVPIPMTPEAIQDRLGRALGERLGTRDPRRRRTLGRMVYALMAEPWLSNAQAAAAAGISAQAAQRVLDVLVREGLLERTYRQNVRWQRLSRAGEDWVLPQARGEV